MPGAGSQKEVESLATCSAAPGGLHMWFQESFPGGCAGHPAPHTLCKKGGHF